jgi:iron-sulfur cluster assembly protein
MINNNQQNIKDSHDTYHGPSPMRKNYITISDEANIKIVEMLNKYQRYDGIKIGLKQKGCSGLMYNIEFADKSVNVSRYDDLMDFGNFKIYVDPKISMFIIGTQMIYVHTDVKSGFEFINPNEKGKCGCGSSFYV